MKYNWDKMDDTQKWLAVEREMELETHNGTTKDDFAMIMIFLYGKVDDAIEDMAMLVDSYNCTKTCGNHPECLPCKGYVWRGVKCE